MICPKCGKELPDGRLYCEHCGGEVNLVPEFETEIEDSMAESMLAIMEEMDPEDDFGLEEPRPGRNRKGPSGHRKKGGKVFFISGIAAALLLFVVSAAVSGGLTVWKNSTFIQEMFVEYYLSDENYEEAIAYMGNVIEKSSDNVIYRFRLGEIYLKKGDAEHALEIYKSVAEDEKYTMDERIAATEYVIKYYSALKDFDEIAAYLESVSDADIKMAFKEYMSGNVSFSQPEGTYAAMITLKLSSDGIGKIYYTTDGTEPDETSLLYQNTIFLEHGDNVISAVFINDYGVKSKVQTKNYFIEARKVSPPEVLTYSGSYSCPTKIEILQNPDSTVYYTTDGSTPNRSSTVYRGPFYAPLGKSTYKFIAVGRNGEVSDVVSRNIQIVLDTEMTTSDAEALLVNYHVEQLGATADQSGHILVDEQNILIFEYLYPMTISVGIDCYYFAEVSRDVTTGVQYRTNTYYGVDVRSGEIHIFNE